MADLCPDLTESLKLRGLTESFSTIEMKYYLNKLVDELGVRSISRGLFKLIRNGESSERIVHRNVIQTIIDNRKIRKHDEQTVIDGDIEMDNNDNNTPHIDNINYFSYMLSDIMREIGSYIDLSDTVNLSKTSRYHFCCLMEIFKCSNVDDKTMNNLVTHCCKTGDYKKLELLKQCNGINIKICNNRLDQNYWKQSLEKIISNEYFKNIKKLSINCCPSKMFIDIITSSPSISTLNCIITVMPRNRNIHQSSHQQISISDIKEIITTKVSQLNQFSAKFVGYSGTAASELFSDEMLQYIPNINIVYNVELLSCIARRKHRLNQNINNDRKEQKLSIEFEPKQWPKNKNVVKEEKESNEESTKLKKSTNRVSISDIITTKLLDDKGTNKGTKRISIFQAVEVFSNVVIRGWDQSETKIMHKCNYCGTLHGTNFDLVNHVSQEILTGRHNINKGGYKICEKCGHKCQKLDAYERHMNTHAVSFE